MIDLKFDLVTLLERLKLVEHKDFQRSIKESSVIGSECYVLELGDAQEYLANNQKVIGEMFLDIAFAFLSKYRKYLTPPQGGRYTLYDKFAFGPSRSMIEDTFIKNDYSVSPTCFARQPAQVTFYVSLKRAYSGQALCIRAILNPTVDGIPSNKGALLLRTIL